MENVPVVDDDHVDDDVDNQISACLTIENPKSFFLFAGAGSGKTRSLVEALKVLRTKRVKHFRLAGQRIGVITYTNAACDEIKQRLDYESLIEVSTIHSFVWSLIGSFHSDIKFWLRIARTQNMSHPVLCPDLGPATTPSCCRAVTSSH